MYTSIKFQKSYNADLQPFKLNSSKFLFVSEDI